MVNCIGEVVDGKGTSAWIWRIFDRLTGILHIRRNGCGFDGFPRLDIHTHCSGVSGAELSERACVGMMDHRTYIHRKNRS